MNIQPNFKKIMIFGRPGSGKSTFACQLAAQTGLPLTHLDKYFFVSGWVERDNKEFMVIQESITKSNAWIIDGNNIKSLETRWKEADLVLYFNYNKIICLFRLIKRLFAKDKNIQDRANNCPEVLRLKLIKYMWTFENRVVNIIDNLKANYPSTKFIEITDEKTLRKVKDMI